MMQNPFDICYLFNFLLRNCPQLDCFSAGSRCLFSKEAWCHVTLVVWLVFFFFRYYIHSGMLGTVSVAATTSRDINDCLARLHQPEYEMVFVIRFAASRKQWSTPGRDIGTLESCDYTDQTWSSSLNATPNVSCATTEPTHHRCAPSRYIQ